MQLTDVVLGRLRRYVSGDWAGSGLLELSRPEAAAVLDAIGHLRDDAKNQMLRQLMDAMGESDHARPQTPAQVWEQMLDKVRSRFKEGE